ncbi:hypothetical protein TVNIR_2117 [Thioalkalivibrio nitratireducens DSM 14787]|uniref:Uncharacterized protein n=1 Tax=Thioalkalivibrio nitratireducens (strain DSM 14787 / UNIQEM 213 / ALEN2) TaxID=1255043 RepID=L0DXK9_THIND|nr:hypothetical protein TVNIR_2117 [Thioalkalivibrio nitratireducens DSM 14787]
MGHDRAAFGVRRKGRAVPVPVVDGDKRSPLVLEGHDLPAVAVDDAPVGGAAHGRTPLVEIPYLIPLWRDMPCAVTIHVSPLAVGGHGIKFGASDIHRPSAWQ